MDASAKRLSVHEHGHQIGDHLYLHRHSPVHELPGKWKLLAGLLFVLVVVATPAGSWLSFAWFLCLLVMVAGLAQLPALTIIRRLGVEAPFVGFALLMPFIAPGPSVVVGPLHLSEAGLVAGASFLCKMTLAVSMAVLLSATTTAGELLTALAELKVPNQLVQIASFMVRYSSVVTDELHRMQVAWSARGFEATGIRSWPTIARTVGALFIRSYERGERVHLAMLSRGFSGELDFGKSEPAGVGMVIGALGLPLLALVGNLIGRLS